MSAMLFYLDDDSDDLEFFKDAADMVEVPVALFDTSDGFMDHMGKLSQMPSSVFLDLNMPQKTGFEILSEIRKTSKFSKIPLVVFSTAGDPDTIEECRKLGANLYIKKVCSLNEMKKIIKFVVTVDWNKFNPDGLHFIYKEERSTSPNQ